jgi:tripeptidyl-peptidase-1
MRYSLFAGLLALGGVDCRSTSFVKSETVENLGRVPEGWKEIGAPAQERRLQFRIAVHSVRLALLCGLYLQKSQSAHTDNTPRA